MSRFWRIRNLVVTGVAATSTVSFLQFSDKRQKSKFLLQAEVVRDDFKRVKENRKSCIVVVGTTGTGKSSTIAKYTGQDVATSKEFQSHTRRCELFSNLKDPGDPVWIDTVGYDDTNNLSDEESFKEVLRFIDNNDLRHVQAIVWTVMPQERMDARLQKQADFINQFGEGVIWNNVIIIAKQPGSFNLEQATQGAREAAKKHAWSNTELKTIGFTYLDDTIPNHVIETINNLPENVKSQMLLVTDEEVHAKLKKLLDEIVNPVQVVFRNSVCQDCGAQGDKRLLNKHCHMEELLIHPQPATYHHPGNPERYHPLELEVYHSGMLRVQGGPSKECQTIRNVMAGATPVVFFLDPTTGLLSASATFAAYYLCNYLEVPIEERWTCCNGLNGTGGCKQRWSCCKRLPEKQGCCVRFPCCMGGPQAQGCQRKFLCCNNPEGSAGCEKTCRKCGAKWGTASRNCYVKPHNLVSVDEIE